MIHCAATCTQTVAAIKACPAHACVPGPPRPVSSTSWRPCSLPHRPPLPLAPPPSVTSKTPRYTSQHSARPTLRPSFRKRPHTRSIPNATPLPTPVVALVRCECAIQAQLHADDYGYAMPGPRVEDARRIVVAAAMCDDQDRDMEFGYNNGYNSKDEAGQDKEAEDKEHLCANEKEKSWMML